MKEMTSQQLNTGTTTIGFLIKDAVILAADKRVTAGKIESEKFTKLFDLSNSIVVTVAGAVSPAQRIVRTAQSQIKLMELKKERPLRIKEAAHLYSSMQFGAIQSGMVVSSIMGGFDQEAGPVLYELVFEGTVIDVEDYYTTGSGSIFVKSILDTEYRSNMTEKEAIELLDKSFKASFKNDTASGGGYIAKVISRDGIKEVARKVVKSELISE